MRDVLITAALMAVTFSAATRAASVDEATWKRVGRLEAGTKLTISVNGAAPVERYLVQATDTELVVLNLSSTELPKRQLLNMTRDNPAWMAGTAKTTYRDGAVRVGPDGVFEKDKKVAELGAVVEHLARDSVSDAKKA